MPRSQATGQTLSPDTYMSIGDAADYLGVTDRTVRNFIARGDLRAYRLGGRLVRIETADVAALIRPIPTAGQGEQRDGRA